MGIRDLLRLQVRGGRTPCGGGGVCSGPPTSAPEQRLRHGEAALAAFMERYWNGYPEESRLRAHMVVWHDASPQYAVAAYADDLAKEHDSLHKEEHRSFQPHEHDHAS